MIANSVQARLANSRVIPRIIVSCASIDPRRKSRESSRVNSKVYELLTTDQEVCRTLWAQDPIGCGGSIGGCEVPYAGLLPAVTGEHQDGGGTDAVAAFDVGGLVTNHVRRA